MITDIIQNEYIIRNISDIGIVILIAFLISFILTPLVGRLAKILKAIDKPKSERKYNERGFETRIHTEPKVKLGGMSMAISIFLTIFIISSLLELNNNISSEYVFSQTGIILGCLVIFIGGFLDDIFELSSISQLLFQFSAALLVIILSLGTISNISFLNVNFSLDILTIPINIGILSSVSVLGFITTVLWIVGMINVVNWVGGVDGLNGTVTSIVLFTMLTISLSKGNIILSIFIAAHLGSILGVLPYNYYPSKIFYGSIGDFLNGFLLSIFAVLSGTKWSTTLILLALPIFDGIYVLYKRFQKYPQYIRRPWKILSISDRNHLHHRLLDAGFSQKTVTLIEASITMLLCSIAIISADVRAEVSAFVLAVSIILILFIVIIYLRKRNMEKEIIEKIINKEENDEPKEVKVEVIIRNSQEENEKKQKFIY